MSLPSLTCVNLAVWFGSSSCSVIYTAAVFQFKPASLLSLCVSDYVIHRGSVWSSSSIPPLFDHETLGVLSVRMKSCGCRGKHTHTHAQRRGWETLKSTQKYTQSSHMYMLYGWYAWSVPYTKAFIHLWISFTVPEAALSLAGYLTPFDTKAKRTGKAPQRATLVLTVLHP